MGNGVRVQSGMTFVGRTPTSFSSVESSGPGPPPASSHFSRATSTPPVFSTLGAGHEWAQIKRRDDTTKPTLPVSHQPKPSWPV
jgi:hypothetical protein